MLVASLLPQPLFKQPLSPLKARAPVGPAGGDAGVAAAAWPAAEPRPVGVHAQPVMLM